MEEENQQDVFQPAPPRAPPRAPAPRPVAPPRAPVPDPRDAVPNEAREEPLRRRVYIKLDKVKALPTTDISTMENWFLDFERKFVIQGYPEDDKLRTMLVYMGEEAANKLTTQCEEIYRDTYTKARDWMLTRYGPNEPLAYFEKELSLLSDKHLSVQDLSSKIDDFCYKYDRAAKRLHIYNQDISNTKRRTAFIDACPELIKKTLHVDAPKHCWTYEQSVKEAVRLSEELSRYLSPTTEKKIEEKVQESGDIEMEKKISSLVAAVMEKEKDKFKSFKRGGVKGIRPPAVCPICKKGYHWASDCWNKDQSNRGRGNGRGRWNNGGRGRGSNYGYGNGNRNEQLRDNSKFTCFKCGGIGHIAKFCPGAAGASSSNKTE